MRRGALLNDAQVSGMLPVSVGGGENAAGNWSLIAGFCGPGSVTLAGFLALIAPCGGSSGLPKEAAAAAVVDIAAPAAAVAAVARTSRLENMAFSFACIESIFDDVIDIHGCGVRVALLGERSQPAPPARFLPKLQ